MPLIGRAFHSVARTVLILVLIGWVLSWPLLIAAAGATLERPDHGAHVAFLVTGEAIAAVACLLGLLWRHDRAWLWLAVGTVGLWLPTAGLIVVWIG